MCEFVKKKKDKKYFKTKMKPQIISEIYIFKGSESNKNKYSKKFIQKILNSK